MHEFLLLAVIVLLATCALLWIDTNWGLVAATSVAAFGLGASGAMLIPDGAQLREHGLTLQVRGWKWSDLKYRITKKEAGIFFSVSEPWYRHRHVPSFEVTPEQLERVRAILAEKQPTTDETDRTDNG